MNIPIETTEPQTEGPYEGSRCLAGPSGRWSPGVIRRLNEDGTFDVELDEKEIILLPQCYGVTAGEISFNDCARWPAVFERFSDGKPVLAMDEVERALRTLGFGVDGPFVVPWTALCKTLFGVEEAAAPAYVLDPDAAYRFFMQLGCSALLCERRLAKQIDATHRKLYWNQTRMGGREPADLPRLPSLDDAFAALGLPTDSVLESSNKGGGGWSLFAMLGLRSDGRDRNAIRAMQRFEERHGIVLPAVLKRFMSRSGVARAVSDAHPNNPTLLSPAGVGWEAWKLHDEPRGPGAPAGRAISVLRHHDFDWVAVFNDGDEDSRIFLNCIEEVEGEPPYETRWALVAPTIGMFFWDLAQTGLCWYQATQFRGGRPIRKTDIGVERVP